MYRLPIHFRIIHSQTQRKQTKQAA